MQMRTHVMHWRGITRLVLALASFLVLASAVAAGPGSSAAASPENTDTAASPGTAPATSPRGSTAQTQPTLTFSVLPSADASWWAGLVDRFSNRPIARPSIADLYPPSLLLPRRRVSLSDDREEVSAVQSQTSAGPHAAPVIHTGADLHVTTDPHFSAPTQIAWRTVAEGYEITVGRLHVPKNMFGVPFLAARIPRCSIGLSIVDVRTTGRPETTEALFETGVTPWRSNAPTVLREMSEPIQNRIPAGLVVIDGTVVSDPLSPYWALVFTAGVDKHCDDGSNERSNERLGELRLVAQAAQAARRGKSAVPAQPAQAAEATQGLTTTQPAEVNQPAQAVDVKQPAQAVGGFFPLLQGGRPVAAHYPGANLRAARAAVGWNEDYLFLLASEGSIPWVLPGPTTPEVAALLWALGAKEAINVDGGGSAHVGLRNHREFPVFPRLIGPLRRSGPVRLYGFPD